MVRALLILSALTLGAAHAQADLVTFETTPLGLTPRDNASLGRAYSITGGTVRFFFDTNGNNEFDPDTDVLPVFEARGDADGDPQGFHSSKNGGSDRPAGGNLGGWFIRQPDGIGPTSNGTLPGPFLIDYNVTRTIDGLSGEIWDIDSAAPNATEQWLVEVLDRSGNVVDHRLSPIGLNQNDPASLDSLPWTFMFSDLTSKSLEVDKVRLTFVGTKPIGIGLSFNNFSAFEAVPEPSSVALLGLGLGGLVLARWRGRLRGK